MRVYGAGWYGERDPHRKCVLGWLHEQSPGHRRPCTSPRRRQCRAGLSEHGYDVRAEWWLKLHDAGGSPEPMQIYDWCQLPF